MNKNKGYLNIKRMEYSRVKTGWYVQVERRFHNVRISVAEKLFTDKKYGNDPAKSLAAAKRYRDKMLKWFPVFCFRGAKHIFQVINLDKMSKISRRKLTKIWQESK